MTVPLLARKMMVFWTKQEERGRPSILENPISQKKTLIFGWSTCEIPTLSIFSIGWCYVCFLFFMTSVVTSLAVIVNERERIPQGPCDNGCSGLVNFHKSKMYCIFMYTHVSVYGSQHYVCMYLTWFISHILIYINVIYIYICVYIFIYIYTRIYV